LFLDFSEEQIRRYSRHIILPEVGGKGQKKIMETSALVVGAGGLGSPCSIYLAAAGVGRLGIVDDDLVDLSNLQRQILHTTADVGRDKVTSACETIRAINPEVEVVPHKLRLKAENILPLVRQYDYVIDGSDNFPTKFLVNDACVVAGVPLSIAGILRFNGQLLTVVPRRGPCYRCVFNEPPPPGLVPSCQEAGVLGAVAGLMGVLQATEVLKLILSGEETIEGNILLVDIKKMSFRRVAVSRNPSCPVCGDNPTITRMVDYDYACDIRTPNGDGTTQAAKETAPVRLPPGIAPQ
jgi:adenylyltransferase/sulfurtransferase